MKKQAFYTWVDRAFFASGAVWLILYYVFPQENSASYIMWLGLAFIALMFLEVILQFITVYRADVKGMSFFEAYVSMRAKQFNYPGRIWIHLFAAIIFTIFILQYFI
jgi:hypothetical protein